MSTLFYLTPTGMKVRSSGKSHVNECGNRVVACYRASTGGWHGWLRLDRLKPVADVKRKCVRR